MLLEALEPRVVQRETCRGKNAKNLLTRVFHAQLIAKMNNCVSSACTKY